MAADLATAFYEQSLRLPRPTNPTLYIRIGLEGCNPQSCSFLLEMQYQAAHILVTEHGFSPDQNLPVFWISEGGRRLRFRVNACSTAVGKYVDTLQRDLRSEMEGQMETEAYVDLVEAPPSQTIMTKMHTTSDSSSTLVVPNAVQFIRSIRLEIKSAEDATMQLKDILVSWLELGAMYQPSSAQPQ